MLASSSKLLDTNGMVNQAAALLSSTSSDFSDMALLVRASWLAHHHLASQLAAQLLDSLSGTHLLLCGHESFLLATLGPVCIADSQRLCALCMRCSLMAYIHHGTGKRMSKWC